MPAVRPGSVKLEIRVGDRVVEIARERVFFGSVLAFKPRIHEFQNPETLVFFSGFSKCSVPDLAFQLSAEPVFSESVVLEEIFKIFGLREMHVAVFFKACLV